MIALGDCRKNWSNIFQRIILDCFSSPSALTGPGTHCSNTCARAKTIIVTSQRDQHALSTVYTQNTTSNRWNVEDWYQVRTKPFAVLVYFVCLESSLLVLNTAWSITSAYGLLLGQGYLSHVCVANNMIPVGAVQINCIFANFNNL